MGKRILIIIGISLSLLIVGLYFSYDYFLERRLKYRLSEIISKDPNSLYKYSFKKLNIDLTDGSVELKGIRVEPYEWAFDSLLDPDSKVRILLAVKMDEIELLNFGISDFIRTKKIKANSLRIIKPSFSYYFNPQKKSTGAGSMVFEDLFSDQFISADLENFEIVSGSVLIDNYNSPDPAVMINNLEIKLSSAHMDRMSITKYVPFEYAQIKVGAGGIGVDISDDFSIVSDSVYFNANTQSFSIRDFQLRPKYNKENFAAKYNVQKQWFAIKLASLDINNIDLDHFVNTGNVKIGSINLIDPNIALYKDKSKPVPPFKKKPLLAKAIKSIPWNLEIDSVSIENGYIAIEETSPKTGLSSHLSLDSLEALITNVTNMDSALARSSIMEIDASTLVYNKARINVNMKIDLLSEIDRFMVNGNMGAVYVTTFNPVLEPMMGIKATDGRIDNLKFEFTAMDTLSTGTLDMEYENVKLEVLNMDTSSNKDTKGFMSFAANTVVNSNNSRAKGAYTQGIISTDRVLEKDVWPYLWHSIQSGLVSTIVPITNNKEAKQIQKQNRQDLRNK